MKKVSIIFLLAISVLGSLAVTAQDVEKVSLVQTPGKFEQTELKLEAGKAYVFEVENKGVDHAIGFVIAAKGNTGKDGHISSSYLNKTIKDGESSSSKQVILEKGEYVYFCPLNPTPQYTIVVE